MKKSISFIFFFLIFTSFMSLNAQWVRTYGGSGDEYALSIQETSDGGYIVAGYTDSFGAGDLDIWVLKLSSTGTIDWQHTYGGSGIDWANSIQQTSDGGYVVAGCTDSFGAGRNDIWVLKLSSTGIIDWQHTYGGSDSDWANSIQQTSDGGYIVVGETNSFGDGISDIWVLKLSSTGTVDWQHTYGGIGDDKVCSIQQTSDGGYIVAGPTWSFGAGGGDIWVLKLSSTGTVDWQHTYGGSNRDLAYSIQQTSDGGYIVAGRTWSFGAGSSDIWVLKLSSTGTIDWQHTYEGSDDDWANSIQQTSDGGYIVAGETQSFGAGGYDIWALKLSSTGTIDWQHTYGGSDAEYASSIQETSDGGYIVAGITWSFGAEDSDFLIFKLLSDGDIDPFCGFIGSSNALIVDTSISLEDTSVIPQNTDVIPLVTNVSPQETNASIIQLCQEYNLTISASAGGTTNPVPETYTHDSGTQVSVQAFPSNGYQFSGWSGDASGTTNPINIIMDDNKSVTANFSQISNDGGDGDGDKDSKGGGCFIATAAYGSPLHPHIETLRDFRDKYLMSNELGREFVDLYYKYSPFVANIIARSKPLKVLVRIHLIPIIVLSYSMVHLGPIITGGVLLCILVLPVFFIYVTRRR